MTAADQIVRSENSACHEAVHICFLAGYYGAERGEGGRRLIAPFDPLLDLFIVEKAAYEVGYEAANRPDWTGLPTAGPARAAARLP